MKRCIIFIFAGFLFLGTVQPLEAGESQTLQSLLPEGITQSDKDNFFTLAFENDSIGTGTDSNYTSGLRLSYFDLNTPFPDFADDLADLIPTFDINRTSSVFYSVGHNLYTPEDIESRTQPLDDRPWAAFLYGSMGMATLTDNHIDELEVTLGIIGPLALGEQIQKAVHKHVTNSPIPLGWDNQLENEPGLILSWQRRWPFYASYKANGLLLTASPNIGASVGNIYTYAHGGLQFNLRLQDSVWEDMPLRVRPAMPGTGFFTTPERGWGWSVFGGLEGRAIARNIFLDGNTFQDSYSVDKKPFVLDANLGVAFTFQDARVSYTVTRRSREFDGQDKAHIFGALSLTYKF